MFPYLKGVMKSAAFLDANSLGSVNLKKTEGVDFNNLKNAVQHLEM